MLRRTLMTSVQRSAAMYSKAAAKPAAAKAAESKGPQMSKVHGATGPEGDSAVDKALVAVAVGSVAAWWFTVSGPKHQH